MTKTLDWDKLFSNMANVGNLEFDEFDQPVLDIQMVKIYEMEQEMATLVYLTLGDVPLTSWIAVPLLVVFSSE